MMGDFLEQGGEKFVNVIQIDPFNLDKEREEGYFDTEGNFVEYVDENEIKVTQALRRLKGTSNKKEKMSAETKHIFEQLTEDAVRLMEENGEYNVYHENQETFECEAEGYARLAQSKEKADAYDMFADDDEDATAVKPSSDELNTVLGPNSNAASQSSSDALNTASEVTVTAAVWAITMTHLLDFIARLVGCFRAMVLIQRGDWYI